MQPANKVRFHHVRNVGRSKKYNYTIAIMADEKSYHVGLSQCSSNDQFCRAVGRNIAKHRAEQVARYQAGLLTKQPKYSLTIHADDELAHLSIKQREQAIIEIAISEAREVRRVNS